MVLIRAAVAIWAALICVAPLFAAEPFRIVMLPDTQFYSQSHPEQFKAQTEWIVKRMQADNIRFVTHVGDIVQDGGQDANRNVDEWTNADAAMAILDKQAPDLPYGAVLGNHDYDQVNDQAAADQYVKYFGPSRYEGKKWYGGASPDGRSHYQTFTAGGRQFLHLTLEWRAREASLMWAAGILKQHATLPTIVTTHEYTQPGGRRAGPGQRIFDRVVKPFPQVFLVLSGHIIGEGHQVVKNDAGLPVIEVLADYQNRPRGGDGWLRVIEFDEEQNRLNFTTYSPTLDKSETDSNSQFSLKVDFAKRLGPVAQPAEKPASNGSSAEPKPLAP